MSLKFRGGELYQRGRGIGGLFRAIRNAFKLLLRTAGSSIVRAANSQSGKVLGKALKEQALTSVANLSADVLRGNDLGESFNNELASGRENIANTIENVTKKNNKRRNEPIQRRSKKIRRGNVKSKLAEKYKDVNSKDIFS